MTFRGDSRRGLWTAVLCALAIGAPATVHADDTPPVEAPGTAPAPVPPTPPPAPEQPSPEPGTEPAPTPDTEPAPMPDGPPIPRPDSYDRPVLRSPISRREIVIDVPGLRTRRAKILSGGLLAAGVIAGSVGLVYTLDSRTQANKVSAQLFTGKTWSDELQRAVDNTDRSRTRAIIAYSIGGAFVAGAIAAYIATEPKAERHVIRPHHAGLTPVRGGAVATSEWSF